MEPSEHTKSRAQFQAQAGNYGKSHILADTSDIELVITDLARPQPGTPALDIATGGGHGALALARFGYSLTVCDLTPAMVKQSRAQLEAHQFANPRPELADAICPAESLPYPDDSFALVACRVAPHHFADPAAFVGEAARALRPGGFFLLIDGSLPDDDPETAAWLNRVERLRDPSHARLIERTEWSKMVEESGLELLAAELHPFEMPDLEWYFETAATSPENRQTIRQLIDEVPASVRAALALRTEPNRPISWTWQRLSLLARKAF